MQWERHKLNLIANFRKLPEDKSRSVLKPSLPIADLVEVLVEKYKVGQPTLEERIAKHWRAIMGDKLAERCAPVRILDGKRLILQVNSAPMKQELEFQRRRIVQKIRRIQGCESIQDIMIRMG